MSPPESDLGRLLATLKPVVHPGVYVFSSIPDALDLGGLDVVATMREPEGLTVVLEEGLARTRGLPVMFRAAWITLTVHSDLAAVGLTAAFSGALARAGISCNVMAGAYHDHVFVPVDRARDAMDVLFRLQREGRPDGGAS
jgi:hypothetical protein